MPVIGRAGAFRYVLLGLITGLTSFLFINLVNRVVAVLIGGGFTQISREYMTLFAAVILAFVWARRELAMTSINLSLRISWALRKKILSLVLAANYRQFSGRESLVQSAIVNDVGSLTNAALSIIDFSIALIMALACLVYLSTISVILFLLTLVVVAAGVMIYYITSRANIRSLEQSRQLETVFHANVGAVLTGFKELCITPEKGRYIYENRVAPNAEASYRHDLSALSGFVNNQVIGQVFFYVLVASILVVFSVTLGIVPSSVVSYVFTLMYLLGAIVTVMSQLPTLHRAEIASRQLEALKVQLEEVAEPAVSESSADFGNAFQKLVIRDVEFSFSADPASFRIGPISLQLLKGETVFIYGGNGSGKTTLLYVILGLYWRGGGDILLNGTVLRRANYADYRRLFAVVFNDFYLFDEFLADVEPDEGLWRQYLELFELQGKVELKGRQLSTTDLSTGQRKRLALILALMEKKPILVLDEWAADQDPHFRMKFYARIIPFLNASGTTVLAITHDDRYYSRASRLYKMDEGALAVDDGRGFGDTEPAIQFSYNGDQ